MCIIVPGIHQGPSVVLRQGLLQPRLASNSDHPALPPKYWDYGYALSLLASLRVLDTKNERTDRR